MKKEVITSNKAALPVGPYSQAIRVGDLIFVAGEKGIDPATSRIVEGGIGAELHGIGGHDFGNEGGFGGELLEHHPSGAVPLGNYPDEQVILQNHQGADLMLVHRPQRIQHGDIGRNGADAESFILQYAAGIHGFSRTYGLSVEHLILSRVVNNFFTKKARNRINFARMAGFY